MRRKEKMDTAIPVMAVTGFLVLGVIWCSDSIFRFLHKPDSRIACIDERYTEQQQVILLKEHFILIFFQTGARASVWIWYF